MVLSVTVTSKVDNAIPVNGVTNDMAGVAMMLTPYFPNGVSRCFIKEVRNADNVVVAATIEDSKYVCTVMQMPMIAAAMTCAAVQAST